MVVVVHQFSLLELRFRQLNYLSFGFTHPPNIRRKQNQILDAMCNKSDLARDQASLSPLTSDESKVLRNAMCNKLFEITLQHKTKARP